MSRRISPNVTALFGLAAALFLLAAVAKAARRRCTNPQCRAVVDAAEGLLADAVCPHCGSLATGSRIVFPAAPTPALAGIDRQTMANTPIISCGCAGQMSPPPSNGTRCSMWRPRAKAARRSGCDAPPAA